MTRLPAPPWLMLVVDLDRDLPWEGILLEALAGGVNLVQIRFRKYPAGQALLRARHLRALVPRNVPLLVNTRVDLARAIGADGVHLPEGDLPVETVRALFPGIIVGRSIHGSPAHNETPDYWMFGHVFPTPTHPGIPPRGLAALREAVAAASRPVVAIGGITPGNAGSVIRTGAAGVAVISAIAGSEHPRESARALMETMRQEMTP